MAIKFGDILQNQNAAFPIVEASNNDIKGVIFSNSLPGENDFPNKRALGTILIDNSVGAQKMYIYKGGDLANGTWGTNSNWEVFATGAGETIQTNNLVVSIPDGRSFGRFISGQTIDVGSGESAMQIIIDAITSFQAPTGAFDSAAQTPIQYDTEAQSNIARTITFTVTNNNQAVISGSNFTIAKVRLLRKYAGGNYTPIASTLASDSLPFTSSALTAINTQGTVTAGTFTFNDTLSTAANNNQHFVYKIEITPNDASGSATTAVEVEGSNSPANNGFLDVLFYSAPTTGSLSITRQNTSSHFVGDAEGNFEREKGNIATKIQFTINCNSPLVPITEFKLQRAIDSNTFVDIHTEGSLSENGTSSTFKFYDSVASTANNVTGQDDTPTGFTDTSAYPVGSIDANFIKYRVVFTDDEQTTTLAAFNTINLEFPALIGYNTEGGGTDGPSSLSDAQLSTAINAIRSGSSANRRQYEIINTSGTGSPNFGAGVSITPNSTQFTYIAFPASYNEISTFQKPSTPDEYGSFDSDPRSITVDFTTHYGITNSDYEVYVSNSAGAFNGTYTIN
tara:strand:+ start:1448 stop:3145 length:1698 start_codon:yes stop_codon:yes gene_type:complete